MVMDAETIQDILQAVGPLQIRKMFGGQGVYHDGLMFALEIDGKLYLKADDEAAETFRKLGSKPFSYKSKGGKPVTMGYWLMPEDGFDDPEEAAAYAAIAIGVARRAKGSTKKVGSTSKKAAKKSAARSTIKKSAAKKSTTRKSTAKKAR